MSATPVYNKINARGCLIPTETTPALCVPRANLALAFPALVCLGGFEQAMPYLGFVFGLRVWRCFSWIAIVLVRLPA